MLLNTAARTVAALAAASLPLAASAATGYTFLPVGPENSTSNDITNSGYVFIDVESSNGSWIGSYYGNGVDPYKTAPSEALGVRDAADGSIWAVDGWSWQYWNSARGKFSVQSSGAVTARDIDRDGRVVGHTTTPAGFSTAFVYGDFGSGVETRYLPDFGLRPVPNQPRSHGATAISNSGYVVGGIRDTDGASHGFVYNTHTREFRDIGLGLTGVDVNDDGKALFTNDGLPGTGYIYDAKTDQLTDMGWYGNYIPNAINRWGQVVGTRYVLGSKDPFSPILWENGKFTNLKPLLAAQGFVGWNATGINDKGQIALWGYYQLGGASQALILTPTTGTSSFFPQSKPVDSTASAAFTQAATGDWFASRGLVQPPTTAPAAPVAAAAPTAPQDPQAYHYAGTDGTRFARVMDFPKGFDGPVVVSVEGIVLGTFEPGQSVRFSDYADQLGALLDAEGVRAFDVTGIRLLADLDDQPDFALQLAFTLATGDFKIQGRNDLIGDANGDHFVDFVDFTLLADAYGDTGQSWFSGDFDLDGTVDLTDFQLFVTNVNQPLSPEQQREIDAFVPEPTALAPLGLAALALRRRRR